MAKNEFGQEYDEVLGTIGKEAFFDRVVPMASYTLTDDKRLRNMLLGEMIARAAWMKPREVEQLWAKDITPATFDFQRQYKQLMQASGVVYPDQAYHINTKQLLEHDLIGNQLIPKYLLKGKPFDAKDYKNDPDYYRTCFIDGSVDRCAAFLTSWAYGWVQDEEEKQAMLSNGLFIPKNYAVAIVDRRDTFPEEEHGLETVYDLYNTAETYETLATRTPINVKKIIPIPVTFLLPKQAKDLRETGRQLLKNGTIDGGLFRSDEENVAKLYEVVRQQELAVKYSLLNQK